MNYLKSLERANDAKLATIDAAKTELRALLAYLMSDKFAGVDNDYVHVRTDILPRLTKLANILNTEFTKED